MNTASRQPVSTLTSRSRFQAFLSLQWYEEAIKFLFTFVAKTSEILLAVGLVTSTANFLTDGQVMGTTSTIANAWAWAQALAIDSSLSVTCLYVFASLKQRDWLKAACYGLLTGLLAFVAGMITNADTLSHAAHITMAAATAQMGLDITLLTTLRAIAVVGFVLMSRLKETSFKELYATPAPPPVPVPSPELERRVAELLMQALAQQGPVMVTEEQKAAPPDRLTEGDEPSARLMEPLELTTEPESQMDSQETRLQQAYQELEAEGQRPSGRLLAARVHLRRTTCNQWLEKYHPEVMSDSS